MTTDATNREPVVSDTPSDIGLYLLFGDPDKDFHRPECECRACEDWRAGKGRPRRKDLRGQHAK